MVLCICRFFIIGNFIHWSIAAAKNAQTLGEAGQQAMVVAQRVARTSRQMAVAVVPQINLAEREIMDDQDTVTLIEGLD
jgi:nucleoid-associated protein YgaU